MTKLTPQLQQELARLGAKIKALQPTVKHSVSAESGTILELSARGQTARIQQDTYQRKQSDWIRFR